MFLNAPSFPKLLNSRRYWRFLNFVEWGKFKGLAWTYKYDQKIEEKSLAAKMYWELTVASAVNILLACVSVYFLHLSDGWLQHTNFYNWFKLPTSDGYETLLSVSAATGGVLLGLYYNGILVVGSSIYAKAPNNIRNLFAEEKVGNNYIKLLSFLTFLSIVLLVAELLHYQPSKLGVVVVLFMNGLTVFSFALMGRRAFSLFNPTVLYQTVAHEFIRLFERAQANSLLSKNKSIQLHLKKMANRNISALNSLSQILKDDPNLSGRSFAEVFKSTCGVLYSYESAKRRIHTSSRWYEQKYLHKRWHAGSGWGTRDIALQTGTQISPEAEPDYFWFERKLERFLYDVIETNLRSGKFKLVFELIEYLEVPLSEIALNGDVEECSRILGDIFSIVLRGIEAHGEKSIGTKDALALVEMLAVLRLRLFMRTLDSIIENNFEDVCQKLSKLNWMSNKTIYEIGLPYFALKQGEWLHKCLSFEIETEGYLVSPHWYQRTMIKMKYAENIKRAIDVVINDDFGGRVMRIKNSNAKDKLILESVLVSRELEFQNKLNGRIRQVEGLWTEAFGHSEVKGLAWPNIDFSALSKKIDEQEALLLGFCADLVVPLNNHAVAGDKELPDYSGQFLVVVGQYLTKRYLNQDLKGLSKVFEAYFAGTLLKFTSLLPRQYSGSERDRFLLGDAFEPVLDLVDVSGWAKLVCDLKGDQTHWNEICAVWDKQNADSGTPSFIEKVGNIIAMSDNDLHFSRFDDLRTSRGMEMYRMIEREVPVEEVFPKDRSFYVRAIKKSSHPSKLVRIFAEEESVIRSYSGTDIFLTSYFWGKPGFESFERFGWRRKQFLEELVEPEQEKGADEGAG